MKPVSCPEVDRSLWLYIDRELSAGELAAISAHLRQCDSCRAAYHERAREATQYRMAFLDAPFGDRFAAKLRGRMVGEGLLGRAASGEAGAASGREDPARGAWPARGRGRFGGAGSGGRERRGERKGGVAGWLRFPVPRARLRRLLTVAAMVPLIAAVVVAGLLFNTAPSDSLGTVVAEGGAVSVRRARGAGAPSQESPVSRSARLLAGDACMVGPGGVATLRLAAEARDGETREPATLTLRGPAALVLDSHATRSRFSANLEEGTVLAEVSKRKHDETFELWTQLARAFVVGTRFELRAGAEGTQLNVLEGKVKFQRRGALPDHGSELVSADRGPFVMRLGNLRPVPLAGGQREPGPAASAPPAAQASPEPAPPPAHAASPAPAPAPPSRPDLDNPVDPEKEN